MAAALCRGFQAHDQRAEQQALRAFAYVDRHQFAHLSPDLADDAAGAYVDALWAKDRLEDQHRTDDGQLDTSALARASWRPVRDAFRERAEIVGMPQLYATESTLAWKRHKVGGDYWTPMLAAQTHELRYAMHQLDYPDKHRHGTSGWGPEAVRYLLGVELHDRHDSTAWQQAVDAMTPYYQAILDAHEAMTVGGETDG